MLSIFKAAVVKPLDGHCKCIAMGNFYSLITSPNETVLKWICADFKGLPNGADIL